jgi:hypothetical protein
MSAREERLFKIAAGALIMVAIWGTLLLWWLTGD